VVAIKSVNRSLMDMMLGKGLSSTAPRESIELTPVEPELVGELPGGRAGHVHQTVPRDAPGRLMAACDGDCIFLIMIGSCIVLTFGFFGLGCLTSSSCYES
jgi:hypothetical protein